MLESVLGDNDLVNCRTLHQPSKSAFEETSLTISVAPRFPNKVKEAVHSFDFPSQVSQGGRDWRVSIKLHILLNSVGKFSETSSDLSWY